MTSNERLFQTKAERDARKADREEQKVERRLAAIMACDVCGYSRLMEQDEVSTVAALKGHREHLVDPKIAEHRGRIVNTAGDSVLVEFVSVVDAVRCAVDIQRGMHDRNLNVDPARKLEFRIGINVGDVIIQGNEIFGDGVNIAARLESMAQPGGILVSQTVRDYVRDKLAFGFQDLGAHRVKNISHPVTVAQIQFE
jgi:adenylate cyclase